MTAYNFNVGNFLRVALNDYCETMIRVISRTIKFRNTRKDKPHVLFFHTRSIGKIWNTVGVRESRVGRPVSFLTAVTKSTPTPKHDVGAVTLLVFNEMMV